MINKYQEALYVLHGFANGNLIREFHSEYQREKNDEFARILNELVEKSIPKSVELYQNEPGTIYNVICPNCGEILFMITDLDYEFKKEDSYCSSCGQSIKKWSDES